MLTPRGQILAVVLLDMAALARAGELRLDNGAILPGELVSVSSRNVVWQAEKVGEVTVAKADVLALQSSSRVSVELAKQETAISSCLVEVESGQWSLHCDSEQLHSVAFTELRSLPPAISSTGKFSTALNIDRGANPSEEIKVDLTARWLRPGYRHNVYLSTDYEQSNGKTTDDDADANYQFDLLRDRGWYWFGRTRYYRDEFEALQDVYAVAAGPGREFTPATDLTLSIQGGPALMYFHYVGQGWQTEPGANVRWTALWQTPWRGIEVSHSAELGWIFAVSDGYLFQSKTGLTFPLYQGLVAELRLDYDKAGVDVGKNGDTDTEWVLALGYRW